MFWSVFTIGIFFAGAIGAPTELRHVVHEKRSVLPNGWTRGGRLEGHRRLPLRIAMTQSNLDKIEAYLMEVSHPTSGKYGKHWTPQEVAETFAPASATFDAVQEWLRSSGIDEGSIQQSQSLGWLDLNVTVAEAEELLKTEYSTYQHATGASHVGCDAYHVPEHVSPHVDFITPTVHFTKATAPERNGPPKPQGGSLQRRDVPGVGNDVGKPGWPTGPKKGRTLNFITNVISSLDTCNQYIVPSCLRSLYQIPTPGKSSQTNPLGIVAYTPQEYVQSDLNTFFKNYSTNQVQTTPKLVSIDGGPAQTADRGFNYNGESDLDLEYSMSLANPIPVTLYQVGDTIESASFNTFLDALDKSYCAENDASQDPPYPDPNMGGYKGPLNCGGAAATKVISTSYGYNEADLTPLYEQRQCNEYAKLGMMGTSFLYSSGDFGVAGNGGACIDPKTGDYNNGTSGKFNPAFPSTCPYVTSVGATQVPGSGGVNSPEVACYTVIYSGGGFSNVFPIPSYQNATVAAYFTNSPPAYGAARFNNSRKVRGYPDISANGANYVVNVGGQWTLVYGTSASSPTTGAIISIINEYRAQAGKTSVGFLNPTLYAHPEVLNDIVSGNNPGCGTNGFSAVPGWDPVTGLGTPNTPKMIKLFNSLP